VVFSRCFESFPSFPVNRPVFSLAMAEEKIPVIDLSSVTKTFLGGQFSAFKCDLPGALLNIGDAKVAVAAKKIQTSKEEKIRALFPLRHENLVRLIALRQNRDECFLIMELCPRTLAAELAQCRQSTEYINPVVLVDCVCQLTEGIKYLHDNGIVHGNIKPTNILLDAKMRVRIADIGLRNEQNSEIRYTAPEVLRGEEMNLEQLQKCDGWSYGVVIWEMMTGRIPYGDIEESTLREYLTTGAEIYPFTRRPPLPAKTEIQTLVNMLHGCWMPDIKWRSSFNYLATHLPDLKKEIIEWMDCLDEDEDRVEFWAGECQKWANAKHSDVSDYD
ncbi:hypothetical protein PFISCL1PPCAC_24995, partial [Pristionchus fissidentatus]